MSKLRSFILAGSLAILTACKPPSKEYIQALTDDLSSSNSRVRNQATLKLGQIGPDAAPAVPSLIKLLKDPNRGVQSSAAYALRRIDTPKARKALAQASAEQK